MRIEQCRWDVAERWIPAPPGRLETAQLVFVFGGTELIKGNHHVGTLRAAYPKARMLGCSTAGEIRGTEVTDNTLVVTAVEFEHTRFEGGCLSIDETSSSVEAGERLSAMLTRDGLVHVFVLSDGLKVNGSDLVKGLTSSLPPEVSVTGGLSGDGERFRETWVLWDDSPRKNAVAVLGFYGNRLAVGYGSLGGWDPFGPERIITRSKDNVLYELDGQSALELYKKYLGDHADGLPATGLLFPLSLRTSESETGVVRTILSIDEEDRSMTFAGDVPEGSYARLMKANFDRLIDGAAGAANACHSASEDSPDLAILISCVGRKMVLQQRIEEEVESVRDVLGDDTVLAGFYSYGEISPFMLNAKCELHNQTMTITTFSEH